MPELDSYTSNLFYQNEIYANKMISFVLYIVALLDITIVILSFTGAVSLENVKGEIILLLSGILIFLVIIFARVKKYKSAFLKPLLLTCIIFFTGLIFSFYPMNSGFIRYGPIIISAMYYDKRFTHITSIISWLIYSCLLWANVVFEGKVFNMEFDGVHGIQYMDIFKYPRTVLTLYYIPQSVLMVFTAVVGISIADRGKSLVFQQSKYISVLNSMKSEIAAASEIQNSVLPSTHFVTEEGNIEINARMISAKDVAGDFFDYFVLPNNNLVFLIADVSDKGTPAAMFMMQARTAIHYAMLSQSTLEEAVTNANEFLCHDNKESMFVTMWIGCINIHTGLGKYINCGHCPAVVKDKDGKVSVCKNEPNLFLGAFSNVKFKAIPFKINEDDTVFIYTDGLTDIENDEEIKLGSDRLIKIIGRANPDPSSFCSDIMDSLFEYSKGSEPFDDMTMLSLKLNKQETPLEKSFCIDSDSESLEKIYDEIDKILEKRKCPDKTRQLIEVAFDEICTNIVDYAYENSKGKIEITISTGENYITLKVCDYGPKFDPLSVEIKGVHSEPEIGGLGLHLVKNIMDKIEYSFEDGKNILRMSKIWNV